MERFEIDGSKSLTLYLHITTLHKMWKIFTLDDEETKLLGQEISNELGQRIIEQLKYPKSPNDLAKELNLPLTTVIFHIEKLVNAGVVKPIGKMAGKRGRKTLYTLVSPAFLILPVRKEERESFMRDLMERIVPPREIMVKSLIVGLLVAIFVVGMPWYLMGYRNPQPLKLNIAESATKRLTTTVAIPATTTAEAGKEGKVKHALTSIPSKASEDRMIMLIFGLAASLLAALITAAWALRREVHLYSEHNP